MLQRLPIALAQVKASNTSDNLLNEICQLTYFLYDTLQIVYRLYWAKEITKKVYNNIMNSKIKTGHYLELLTPETMKFIGSTKSNITKYKNDKNTSYLKIAEVVLFHCNIDSDNYQQKSRALYTFVPNKSFVQLLDISSKNFIFLKTFD